MGTRDRNVRIISGTARLYGRYGQEQKEIGTMATHGEICPHCNGTGMISIYMGDIENISAYDIGRVVAIHDVLEITCIECEGSGEMEPMEGGYHE